MSEQTKCELCGEPSRRAIKQWQEANPGNDLTWPDTARLDVWLMERIDALETELAALRERVEWRPIETAPKDGTRLILATISDGDVDSSSGYWTDHNGGGWVRFMPWQPTHWLPLPPIPTDTKETGE